jgi:hypothetical protein
VPQLLPRSSFFYTPDWLPHAGRLTWALIITTFGILWAMLLMKNAAVKNKLVGPAIFVLGIGAGVSMVVIGRITDKTPLVRDTLVPNGYLIAWACFILGIWTMICSIHAKQLKLPMSKTQLIVSTAVVIIGLYILGGFVHSISILCLWISGLALVTCITMLVWGAAPRPEESTWAEAIFGAILVFVMMTFIYAIIPHEWINYATSYLGFTKDVKVSKGGEFFLKTWLHGNFWTKRTRVLPLEVNFETLQDQLTGAIYVAGAVLNIKMFAAWQKRNQPVPEKVETEEEAPSKLSRFGRPLRKLKSARA